MMERVVRNNTRKSSLFKIQAEKSRFEEHVADFGLCKLFEVFPECSGHKEFLKDLTETFINYSFEVTRKSPFFKGMNYNSKEMGFAFSSNTINYKEWLPGVKEAFLVGNFSEARYPLEETEDGFFQVVIHEEGQSKKMEGAKVCLEVTDNNGNQFKIPPPSSRIVHYDQASKELYGICKEDQTMTNESVELNILLAYQLDLHQTSLSAAKSLIPQIVESKFNTVILRNLFSFKDKSLKTSLLNRFSLKLSYEEVEQLKDLIDKLKEEQVIVLFELDFHPDELEVSNSMEQQYYAPGNAFPFNLEDEQTTAFLLSFVSYYLKYFGIDGYKIANIHQLMLKKDKVESYLTRESPLENFIADCAPGSLLFIKMLNMVLRRCNQQSISYATSRFPVPGLTLALDEGGFGFSFSSQTQPNNGIKSLLERTKNQYFNLEVISSVGEEPCHLASLSFISKKGIVHRDQQLFTSISQSKELELLKPVQWFRAQADYFYEVPCELGFCDGMLTFERGGFSFLCNLAEVPKEASVVTESSRVIFGSNTESLIISKDNGRVIVEVPKEAVFVLERTFDSQVQ